MGDAEHHGLGRPVLHPLAIELEPQFEFLRVPDLIGRYQPRADRAESVIGLALGPLAGALGLEFSL